MVPSQWQKRVELRRVQLSSIRATVINSPISGTTIVIDPLRVNQSVQVQKLRVTARGDGLVGSHIWCEQPVSFVRLSGLVISELMGPPTGSEGRWQS